MNLSSLLKLQSTWSAFKKNHPKFPLFLKAVSQNALSEGTIFEFKVTNPEGKTYQANIKLTESDLDLIEDLKKLFK